MKIKMLVPVFLALFAAVSGSAFAIQEKSLYDRFEGKSVKVYVAPVEDATAEKVVSAEMLKTQLEEALKARRSVTFVIVSTPEEAEITVASSISEYLWTDHDPIDMLVGIGGTAMDAAVTEDYARLQANFTVTNVKSGRPLWKERVMATITKKPMSQADSIPLVTADLAKQFVQTAFAKTKK